MAFPSEVEIDEFRGIALADGNRNHPEQKQGRPKDFTAHAPDRDADSAVVVKAMDEKERDEEQQNEDVAGGEDPGTAPAATTDRRGHHLGGLAERRRPEEDPPERDEMKGDHDGQPSRQRQRRLQDALRGVHDRHTDAVE